MLSWAKRGNVQKVQKAMFDAMEETRELRRQNRVVTAQVNDKNTDTVVQYISLKDVRHSENIAKDADAPNTSKVYAEVTAEWHQKRLTVKG